MFCRASMQHAATGQPQSLNVFVAGFSPNHEVHLFASSALSCPIIHTHLPLVSTTDQEILFCFALQSFRATLRRQLHRLFYKESRFLSVKGQAHAKRLPYPHVIIRCPLSTYATPQFLSFLDDFTCSTVMSAHDKAQLRNNPVVRSRARTPAAQPRFQTLFRPQDLSLSSARDPHKLRLCAFAEPRCRGGQRHRDDCKVPRLSLGFPQSLICGAC